jgi:hypothetical protein
MATAFVLGTFDAGAFDAGADVPLGVSAVGAIPSGQAFGTIAVASTQPLANVGAISSLAAFGTVTVATGSYVQPNVGAIPSAEAFGVATVTTLYAVSAVGAIPSAAAFGTIAVVGTVVVALTSVGAVGSAETFGTAVVTTVVAVTIVGGIEPGEAFGAVAVYLPDSIQVVDVGAMPSGEEFGVVTITVAVTAVGGIATQGAFGYPAVVVGALPPKGGSAYEYVVELFTSGATFGPNVKVGELWDLRNLGWSRYDRMPGRGFFTLYQNSPQLANIIPITTHCRITRVSAAGGVEVLNGIVSDYNSTGDDVVFDIYDYVSLLSLSRSGYRTMYPTVNVGSGVVSPQWLLAKNATNSPLGFVATGTIEDPLGTDGSTPIKTNAQFGLMDQMRLQMFYDMTEMGRANTVNQVTFEISRTAPFVFNFWKNKGSVVDIPLVLNGTVSDYTYAPNWYSYRNDLATLGTTVGGGATEVIKTDATSAALFGLRQDVFAIKTLAGISGSTVENDQQQAVAARALKVATQGTPALWVTLVPGTIQPFSGFDINDKMPVEIVNGTDSITGYWRVVGARAIVDEPGERLQVLIVPVMT